MGRGVFFAAMSINESASLDKTYGRKNFLSGNAFEVKV